MRVAVVLGCLVLVASAHAGTALERIEVLRGRGLAVRLHLSAPVVATVHSLPPDGDRPDRIYLDLSQATLDGLSPPPIPGGDALLRVRAGQFDASTVRVVLDLTGPVPFVVRHDDATITVELALPPRVRLPSPPLPAPAGGAPRVVVLDAGHGGYDPGATGIGGLTEKTITLDLAQRVAARLASHETIDVLLTRTDDRFIPIDERIARAADAALFVSLHANAAADVTLSGVEVFYGGGGLTAAASGPRSPVRLGLDVVQAIESRLTGIRTAMRPGTFGVLTRNTVPSVLVEIGYLTNAADAARLEDDAYRALVAEAIAEGAAAFLQVPTSLASR